MAQRVRALDWSSTPLGPIEEWPHHLRSAVSICLDSGFPIALYWGPEFTLLYNDAYSPIPGDKNAWALGRPAREVWPEIWDFLGPAFRQVLAAREAIFCKDRLLPMLRHGYLEECYYDFTLSPIRGQDGAIDGIFKAVIETTYRVLGERRMRLLRELARHIAPAKSAEEACALAAETFAAATEDVPFSLLYVVHADGREARRAGITGIARDTPASPPALNLTGTDVGPWPLAAVARTGEPELVDDLPNRFGRLPGGAWPEPAGQAVVLPIAAPGPGGPAGFLVAGVSPRRALDDDYRAFFELAAGHVATAVANARAYQMERQRAEALAELLRLREEVEGAAGREEALRENEARLAEAQEIGGFGSFEVDVTTWVGRASAALCKIHGFETDEPFRDFRAFLARHVHPGDREWADRSRAELLAGGSSGEMEYRYLHPDGRARILHVRRRAVRDGTGRVTKLVGTVQDITERRRAEAELRASEEQYRLALDVADIGTWRHDLSMDVMHLDGRCQAHYGFDHPDVRLADLTARFHPEEIDRLRGQIAAAHDPAGDGGFAAEHRIIRPDGEVRWLAVRARVHFEGDGAARRSVLVVGTNLDITARKRAEEALQESHSLLNAVVEGTPDAVFVKDREGRYLMINSACARFMGRAVGEVIGKDDTCILTPETAREIMGRDRRVMTAGETETFEETVTAAGVTRTYLTTKGVYRDAQGRVIGLIGIARDITERKRAEQERLAHLRFFESMDRVNRALQGTNDLEQMMSNALDAVLWVFECDRAWLVYPCDVGAASWRVPVERTRPEYPGALAPGVEVPTDPEVVRVFRTVRASSGPVRFGPGSEHRLPAEAAEPFSVQSMMAMAIYPKVDKPYMFGLHQCSYPRVWTPEEGRLFQEVGRRLTDALTSLLTFRNRKKAEEALRGSHALLNAVAEGTSDAIFVKDLRGRYLMMNTPGARLLGTTVAEVIGKDDFDLFPDAAREIMDRDRRVMAAGVPQTFEETATVAGATRTYLSTKGVFRDPQGRVIGLIGIARDVTERKQAEEARRQAQAALRESQLRYKEFFDNTSDCIFLLDVTPDGRFKFAGFNPAEEMAVGFKNSEVSGKFVEEVVPEPLARQVTANYRRCVESGRIIDYDEVLDLPIGRRHFQTVLIPLRDAAGRIHRIDGVAREVTERKQAEEALKESERKLAEAQRVAHVGHWDRDVDADRITWSDETYRIFGLRPQERILNLAQLEELIHPEDRPAMARVVEQALRGGPRYDLEYRVVRPDGQVRTLHSQGDVTWDDSGRPLRMFGTVQDITERKKNEEALRASLREKEALLREVHHRVKNNLQLINSLLNLQACRIMNPAIAELFAESRNRVRSMALVHENLYRAGNFTGVAMAPHIQSLCAHLSRAYGVDPRRVELVTRIADVQLDMDRAVPCGLIVNELVSNAMKHAFPNGRTGRLSVELRALPGGRYALEVADDGAGLPGDFDLGRKDSLGLQLVGDLAQQLHGTLAIGRDGGTTFTITFQADCGRGEQP
jgi:PAS domain S-box-containing protein